MFAGRSSPRSRWRSTADRRGRRTTPRISTRSRGIREAVNGKGNEGKAEERGGRERGTRLKDYQRKVEGGGWWPLGICFIFYFSAGGVELATAILHKR